MNGDTWRPLGATIDLDGLRNASGLPSSLRDTVEQLTEEYARHQGHNNKLKDYYDGNVRVSDYGVTADIENDQTCDWPEKAVSAWAERITLERVSLAAEQDSTDLDRVLEYNDLINAYNQHVPVKGLYGCMAATVTRDQAGHARVRFHGADTFTAIPSPDFTDGVVASGLAIARREFTSWSMQQMVPTVVHLHLPHDVGEFRQVESGRWVYEDAPIAEELPTLYVFAHRRVGTVAPFGRTRITKFVRTLTDDAIRCMWHMQISGAFYSMAKLYMVGLTNDQFDAVMENKSQYQLSRMLALTTNEETGQNPVIGQLSGNSPQPFIEELRSLATQFSGATSVPLDALGIVQDNPSSAEAISSARENIALIAKRDIESDKATLRRVIRAALAIEGNTTTDRLDADVHLKFADPVRYSPAANADWALKVNSMREVFGKTDVAARAVGIDDDELDEVKSEEAKEAAATMARALFTQLQQPQQPQNGGEDDDTQMDTQ